MIMGHYVKQDSRLRKDKMTNYNRCDYAELGRERTVVLPGICSSPMTAQGSRLVDVRVRAGRSCVVANGRQASAP